MTNDEKNPYLSPKSTSSPEEMKQAKPLGCLATLFLANVWNIASTVNRPSEWYSAVTVSVILLMAVGSGVMVAYRGIDRINRVRAMPNTDRATQKKKQVRWSR